MQEPVGHENYPATTVIVSNLVSFLIYGISAVILYGYGLIWVIAYLLIVLLLEFRLMGRHCVDCYYYGKTCAFGKGRVSALFFKRGMSERFCNKVMTAKDIIPDFLVFFIPVLAGIAILLYEFSWTVLILVITLFVLGFLGNALVRGRLACKYCRQREIGCPAEQFFNKAKK
jgi:hypothetical protein